MWWKAQPPEAYPVALSNMTPRCCSWYRTAGGRPPTYDPAATARRQVSAEGIFTPQAGMSPTSAQPAARERDRLSGRGGRSPTSDQRHPSPQPSLIARPPSLSRHLVGRHGCRVRRRARHRSDKHMAAIAEWGEVGETANDVQEL